MGLFTKKKQEQEVETQQVYSLLPEAVIGEIWAGRLPAYQNPPELILGSGEICHFIDDVSLIKEKSRTRYEGNTLGVSFRVAKGVSLRTSGFKGNPIKETYIEEVFGRLFITTKRVIFISTKQSVEKQLSRVTSIQTYADAIALQFGNTSYIFSMPHPQIADRLIRTIRSA